MPKKPIKSGSESANRDKAGRFGPGNRANPRGRPKKGKAQREFEALARSYSPEVIEALMEFVRAKGELTSPRHAACKTMLEYGWGKPKQIQVLQTDIQGDGVIRFTAELDPRAKDNDDK